MADFIRDIRFVARTLLRAPLFATLAVVTLALGIGGTTALFSLVDAVVLRALPELSGTGRRESRQSGFMDRGSNACRISFARLTSRFERPPSRETRSRA